MTCQWCGRIGYHTEFCKGFEVNDPANTVTTRQAGSAGVFDDAVRSEVDRLYPSLRQCPPDHLHYSIEFEADADNTARPSWDDYFTSIALAVSRRADCRRARHGAVIVKDRRIVATGYNGSVAGGASCLKGECPRGLLSQDELPSGGSYENCVALHAEQNAIAYANRADTNGATAYITGQFCDMCGKLMRAAGVSRVVWPEGEVAW